MKPKKFKPLFYSILLGALLLSCSSDGDSDEDGNGEFISASVETISFESSNVPLGATASKIEGSEFITFLVQGFDEAGNAVVIIIPEYDGPGTYDLGNDNGSFSASGLFSNQQTSWSSAVEGGTGTVTVLTDGSEETTGSFEFVGVAADNGSSTKSVTNGQFRVQFEN